MVNLEAEPIPVATDTTASIPAKSRLTRSLPIIGVIRPLIRPHAGHGVFGVVMVRRSIAPLPMLRRLTLPRKLFGLLPDDAEIETEPRKDRVTVNAVGII